MHVAVVVMVIHVVVVVVMIHDLDEKLGRDVVDAQG